MTTTDSQRLARLMAAHEAMVPYWKDGAFNDAPAALAGEYADALLEELESLLTMQIMHEGLDQIGHVPLSPIAADLGNRELDQG